jgi:hypothetical protein
MIRPTIEHFRLTTTNLSAMVGWYARLFGMVPNQQSATPAAARSDSGLVAAWGSNHHAKSRIAILTLQPGGGEHPPSVPLPRHITFECATLDELLTAYVRLKGLGIEPTLAVQRDASTAFCYNDPDHNNVELTVDYSGDATGGTDTPGWIPESAEASLGTAVDPEQLLTGRAAGMSVAELHRRLGRGVSSARSGAPERSVGAPCPCGSAMADVPVRR